MKHLVHHAISGIMLLIGYVLLYWADSRVLVGVILVHGSHLITQNIKALADEENSLKLLSRAELQKYVRPKL